MKKVLLIVVGLVGAMSSAMAQNVTVDVPSGYKVVVVPSTLTVPQAITVAAPQTVYVAPAPVVATAPVAAYHPRARHIASVGEGMIIEHQIDDHH